MRDDHGNCRLAVACGLASVLMEAEESFFKCLDQHTLADVTKRQSGMFDHWMEIWTATTNEMIAPNIATIMQTKARHISARLIAVMYEPCHGHQHADPQSLLHPRSSAQAR